MNMMSFKTIVTCILLIFLSVMDCVRSAGISIHMNVASRVKLVLPGSMKGLEKQYYAGSFHPDAFYNCFGESLAAENAHWPPFLKTAIDYYHTNYQSKGLTNYGLKSFIYGVFTHQVTDVAWHSLQSYQGIMKMISEVEFDGNFQKAHDYLDTIGDFIHLNREFQNLSDDDMNLLLEFYQNSWDYPSSDIVQIYRLMGFSDITETKLNFCMDRGYSALQGEITTVLTDRSTNHKFNINLENSPLSVILLNNYFYGGIDQMVATLNVCLKELTDWFNNGPSTNPWNICKGVFKEHEIKSEIVDSDDSVDSSPLLSLSLTNYSISDVSYYILNEKLYLSSGIPNSQFGASIKIGNYLGKPTIAISAPHEDEEGAVYLIPLKDVIRDNSIIDNYDTNGIVNSMKLTSVMKNENAQQFPIRFGDKMFTWNLNEFEFLLVSEPGLSHFKIFWLGSLVAILESKHTQTTLGMNGIKQWTIISHSYDNINSDGYQDIVIGSMFSDDQNNRSQAGLLLVLSGKAFYDVISDRLNHNSALNIAIIDIDSIVYEVYRSPKSLHQDNKYEQFGSSFASTEDKVLIGINSIGSVAVFEKKTASYLGLLTEAGFVSYDISATPKRKNSKKTSLYAFDNILTGKLDKTEWVIVSCSAYSYNGKCPLCGMAYLYILKDNSFELVTKLVPTKTFEDPIPKNKKFVLSFFGSSMIKITNSVILIGSNSYDDGKGALFMIDLKELLIENMSKTKEETYTLTNLFQIGDNNVGFTNFGFDCIESFYYQNNLYIAVSLTNYFYSQFVGDVKTFTGSVLVLKLD